MYELNRHPRHTINAIYARPSLPFREGKLVVFDPQNPKSPSLVLGLQYENPFRVLISIKILGPHISLYRGVKQFSAFTEEKMWHFRRFWDSCPPRKLMHAISLIKLWSPSIWHKCRFMQVLKEDVIARIQKEISGGNGRWDVSLLYFRRPKVGKWAQSIFHAQNLEGGAVLHLSLRESTLKGNGVRVLCKIWQKFTQNCSLPPFPIFQSRKTFVVKYLEVGFFCFHDWHCSGIPYLWEQHWEMPFLGNQANLYFLSGIVL